MSKKAVVTGSAGFVGRHIIQELDSRGWDVDGWDLPDNDCRVLFDRWTKRYDLVVHCAFIVGGRATIDGKNTALLSNLELDSRLFEWALRTKQRAVLYYSSSAAYPIRLQGPVGHRALQEDDINRDAFAPGLPDANYGWAKLSGERMAEAAADLGLRVHVARPFSGYGGDQSLDYPFPSIVKRARQGDLTVWGPRGQTRDWVHIDDVVKGSLSLYEDDERRPTNICTGIGTEMGDLMRMAYNLYPGMKTNINTGVRYLEDKPTGVHYRVGDPQRFNEHYVPKISLEEGVRRALAQEA